MKIMNTILSSGFIQEKYKPQNADYGFEMTEKDDLFSPFLSSVPWKKGGGGQA